jgi:hypothetical protein
MPISGDLEHKKEELLKCQNEFKTVRFSNKLSHPITHCIIYLNQGERQNSGENFNSCRTK